MHIESLPAEITSHIFLSVSDVGSAINLSSTSHYLRDVYLKQRITILAQAADAEFGPVDDIIQVVTHNSSQPAHIGRSVPLSHALLQQIIRAGRVAQRWEHFYPFKKWKDDFENRRLLSNDERWLFRRAVYRLWLYSKAFHNREHSRTTRNLPELVIERSRLLHNWSSTELGEMLDVHNVMKQVIANNVCPSNGRIQQKFHKRYPESDHQLMFNMHVNYLQSSSNPIAILADYIPTKYNRLDPSRYHEPGAEGWGDDINHYYVVEDMMKLDPEQILFLCDRCPLKSQVEAYVRATLQGGEWFVNNGETFSETLAFVVKQRGGDPLALRQAVEEEEMGVTVHAIQ
ncbi:F-box domain-containing protein [Teratosphaeria destructans]|uniref:F-box domain-containing protein n=1 Tax=Teratosphaeria destructans TaxID=418781 RepID=A0A9W7SRL8_9PEZI|nr:F-box domain-containing protein [Teratosphaeria destructans]